jgi:hypothetical protein
MMSQTQSPVADVEQDRAPADDEAQQDLTGENNDMNQEDLLHDFDFEVKEQDRWLPIANGESFAGATPHLPCDRNLKNTIAYSSLCVGTLIFVMMSTREANDTNCASIQSRYRI